MGFRFTYALAGAAALLMTGAVFAQGPATQPVAPVRSQPGPRLGPGPAAGTAAQGRTAPAPASAMGAEQNRLRNMSPEDQQRFQANIERWRQMPPAERREMRERLGWRQQRLKREAETALRDLGLQLEAEKRAKFEERYMEERKRIEHELRQEYREKRRRALAPVVERLKKELVGPEASPKASAGGSATPSPSPAK